jgi:hypothetical protein
MYMSANRIAAPWNEPIGRPNCSLRGVRHRDPERFVQHTDAGGAQARQSGLVQPSHAVHAGGVADHVVLGDHGVDEVEDALRLAMSRDGRLDVDARSGRIYQEQRNRIWTG